MADIEPLTEDSPLSAQGLDDLITSGNEALDALFAVENPTPADVSDARRILRPRSPLRRGRGLRPRRGHHGRTQRGSPGRCVHRHRGRDRRRDRRREPGRDPVEAAVADEEETASEETSEETNPNPEEGAGCDRLHVQRRGRAPARAHPQRRHHHRGGRRAAPPPPASVLDGLDGVAAGPVNAPRASPRQFGIEGADAAVWRRLARPVLPGPPDADNKDDMAVVASAAKETSLGGSSSLLVAGAPPSGRSTTSSGRVHRWSLDLPETLSPVVACFTSGPDFSAIYNAGFTQTEAQAIVGDHEDPLRGRLPRLRRGPPRRHRHLHQVPLLTNAASTPELVKSTIAKALIAHQHRASAYPVNKMVTASGTGWPPAPVGSCRLQRAQRRGTGRGDDSSAVPPRGQPHDRGEGPHWLKSVIRAASPAANGVDLLAVTDADIARYFGARKRLVQFIFNWQSLANNAVGYPATAQLLVYPGWHLRQGHRRGRQPRRCPRRRVAVGQHDDGLFFFEQGLLLLQNCYASKLVEIVVCAGGVTGGRPTPPASRSDRRTKEREVTRMSDVKVEGLTSDNAILLLAVAEELKLSPRWCAPPPRGTSSPHRRRRQGGSEPRQGGQEDRAEEGVLTWAKCCPLVRGRIMRSPASTPCGRIAPSGCSSIATKGFVSVALTANVTESDEIAVQNASGENCVYEPSSPTLNGYGGAGHLL